MPRTQPLPDDVVDRIAQGIGPRLTALLAEQEGGSVQTELGEGFPCWSLAIAGGAPGSSVSDLARPLGMWHHQVLIDGRPAAFARSYVRPPDPMQVEVVAVGLSDVAADVATASRHAAGVEGDVRMLLVPSHHVTALWVVGDDDERVIVARAPDAARVEKERRYRAEEFVGELFR